MNKRIKKIRLDNDMTQVQFALKLGVKRNTVATYEMGRSEPSNAALSLICKEFGVNKHWLLTGEGEPYVNLQTNDIVAKATALLGRHDPLFESIIEVYDKLDEVDKMALIKATEALVDAYRSKKE